VDLELVNIVKLPCGCANSAYHIGCLLIMLNSGQNKNFCPHCKAVYQIVDPIPLPNFVAENAIQNRKFTEIMLFHLFTNSLMNVFNISISIDNKKYNNSIQMRVLMPFYFLKIIFNYFFLSHSKNDLSRIETGLLYSYFYQTVLFGILIYAFAKNYNDNDNYNSVILLMNNILFVIIDLVFRIVMEYRIANRVAVDN
jgi:hypothetical protein